MEDSNRAPLPMVDELHGIEDRRGADGTRHQNPRFRTLKGATIVWLTGIPVKCIVRNLSQTGAKIEVHNPIPGTFDLIFDNDQARHRCRVVWREEFNIGVEFI
jgi:hypothetical protein